MAQALKKTSTILCSKCGNQVNSQAKFCNYCGQKMENPAVVPAPVLEPVQSKQERESYVEQIKIISQKKHLTLLDLMQLEEAGKNTNSKSEDIVALWQELVRNENKYCYLTAFNVLKNLSTQDEYESFIGKVAGADPQFFVPRIIVAAPQVSLACLESLWDYVRNIDNIWLYIKYLNWAKACGEKLNRTIIDFLASHQDEYLREKARRCIKMIY